MFNIKKLLLLQIFLIYIYLENEKGTYIMIVTFVKNLPVAFSTQNASGFCWTTSSLLYNLGSWTILALIEHLNNESV